jgi:hypothetical protein
MRDKEVNSTKAYIIKYGNNLILKGLYTNNTCPYVKVMFAAYD